MKTAVRRAAFVRAGSWRCWRVFVESQDLAACMRAAPVRRPRRCTVTAERAACRAAPSLQGRRAAARVQELYGDAEDADMAYHRWLDAKQGVAQSGLLPSDQSTGFSATAGRELTYGEFDLLFFCELMETASALLSPQTSRVFVDVGAGYGRIVACASQWLGPEWQCRGIEIVPRMVEVARDTIQNWTSADTKWTHQIDLVEGDYRDHPEVLRKAGISFCFATTWPQLDELANALARNVSQDSLVITIDKPLPSDPRFSLVVAPVDRINEATGQSTAFLYRVDPSAT